MSEKMAATIKNWNRKTIAVVLAVVMVVSVFAGTGLVWFAKANTYGDLIYKSYSEALDEVNAQYYSSNNSVNTQTPEYSLCDLDKNGIPELIIYSVKSLSECELKIYSYGRERHLVYSLADSRFSVQYPDDSDGVLIHWWGGAPGDDGFLVALDRITFNGKTTSIDNVIQTYRETVEERDALLTKFYGNDSIERFDSYDNTGLKPLKSIFTNYEELYAPTIQEAIDTFYDEYEYGKYHSGAYFGDANYLTLDEVGYCIRDLDGDNIPELIFGYLPNDYGYPSNYVTDLFSASKGTVETVFKGWDRNSYQLYSHNYFYNEGRGGALYSEQDIYKYENGVLIFKQGIIRDEGKYYHCVTFPYDDIDGDQVLDESKATRITEEGWRNYLTQYQDEVEEEKENVSSWLIPLTEYSYAHSSDDFDIDLFLANLAFDEGTNPKTNGAEPYKNAVTGRYNNNPTNSFVKQMEADKSLNFWFLASDVMDNTFDFDPSLGVKLNTTFRDYFATVLYSILDVSADSNEVIEALGSKANKNLLKFSKSMYKTIDQADKDKLGLALLNNKLTTTDTSLLKDGISKTIAENTNLLEQTTKSLDFVTQAIDSAKSLEDIYQNVAKFVAVYNSTSETFAVLKAMRANCNDQEMIKVLDRMIACENNAENMVAEMISADTELVVEDIYKAVWPDIRKSLLAALGEEVKLLYDLFGAVEKGTAALCNIFLGTDQIQEQYNKLMVIVMTEDLLYQATQSLGRDFVKVKTSENARNYNQAVDMYFSLYSLECEYVKTFAEKVYLDHLFPNSNKYKEWAEIIAGVNNAVNEYHDLMMSDWLITLLEWNYPELFDSAESTSLYGKVIDEIRESLDAGEWSNKEVLNSFRMPFVTGEVGYLIKDLDVDGIPELIIAPYKCSSRDWINENNFVFSIYSIKDGKVIDLFDSYYNWNFYLVNGDAIVEYGKDNGAHDHHTSIYRIQNSRLFVSEGVRFSDYDGSKQYYHYGAGENPIPFNTVSGFGPEDTTYTSDQFGGTSSPEESISEQTYSKYLKQYNSLFDSRMDLLGALQHIDAELQLDRTELNIAKNNYGVLRVFRVPDGEKRSDVTWESTDESIASVDDYGIVTAHKTGKCEIVAKSADAKHSVRVSVMVYEMGSATNYTGKGNGVEKGPDGKWAYYQGGAINKSYTGIASNENGWWRIKNGYVDFNANGIYKNEFGWWYVKNGKVDFNYTGIAKNEYGWWRVEKGKVNFKANGIYKNEHGWWKTTNGKVTFKETGVFKNDYGWWRVKNSKVDFGANGIYKNKNGWWKTTNGKVTFKENGVFKNENGWWKVKNSKVDFSFTGIASNKYGKWYIKNGKVDFSKNGKVKYNGTTYTIKNGKVQ